MCEYIHQRLAMLPEREEQVVYARFGFNDQNTPETLEQIVARLKATQKHTRNPRVASLRRPGYPCFVLTLTFISRIWGESWAKVSRKKEGTFLSPNTLPHRQHTIVR